MEKRHAVDELAGNQHVHLIAAVLGSAFSRRTS
jgi:hypothetical protein